MARLAAIDLDGTLLRDDGTIAARTRTTLARAQAAGIVVALVTARPPRVLRRIAREVGVTGLAICANGAITYDLAADAILRHTPLPGEATGRIVAALRAAVPGVCFAVEHGLDFGQEPGYAVANPIAGDLAERLDDALVLSAAGVTKLIAHNPAGELTALLALAREIAGATAVVTHSGAPFVEIAAPGITKATALAALCADLGIDRAATIAFGDMPNDLPMLHWAGRAVAVANAHPDVLAVADEIAPSNNEDGVAAVLERLHELRARWEGRTR